MRHHGGRSVRSEVDDAATAFRRAIDAAVGRARKAVRAVRVPPELAHLSGWRVRHDAALTRNAEEQRFARPREPAERAFERPRDPLELPAHFPCSTGTPGTFTCVL